MGNYIKGSVGKEYDKTWINVANDSGVKEIGAIDGTIISPLGFFFNRTVGAAVDAAVSTAIDLIIGFIACFISD